MRQSVSVLLGLMLMCETAIASAESYLGFQVGGVFPQRTGTVDVSGGGLPAGTTESPLSLSSSFLYGLKAGHYFTAHGYSWLGVETDLYNANPNLPQQDTTLSLPPGFQFTSATSCAGLSTCTLPQGGATLRVLTWAPALLMVRYPEGRLRPYAGMGLGLFFAHFNGLGVSASDTAPGFVAKVGVSYQLTEHVSGFAEWKFNHASLNFSSNGASVGADYNANVAAFGLTYAFGR